MGSLLTSLLNSSNALSVYNRVFNVVQNNITNANTPGYAKQDQLLIAMPFNPAEGITGGVMAGPTLSARSEYIEQDVRNQQNLLGDAQQRAADLGQVQPLFGLGASGGAANAMNDFFNGFSQLSVNPNDEVARQSVIDSANQVAQSFNETATGITQVSRNIDSQTRDAIAQLNQLTSQIASLNTQYRSNSAASQDAGLDAQMHAALENLSQLVNFSLIKTGDGAINVYLGGQTPLVIGGDSFQISADFSTPETIIRDSRSDAITSQIAGGSLGAMLQEKNQTLPGYLAQLNKIAQTFADQVNAHLLLGVDKNGAAPTMDLFSYNQPGDAAFSLKVTGITPDQITAALPSAPGGNGNAIAISQLATAPLVDGFTFTEAYGNLGSQVGRDVAAANGDRSQAQDLVTQAQQQRSQQSGVSLNEEAAKLLQFQQAYQAAGKMVTVLNELSQTLMNLIPESGA
ncbi:MAG TPA: flagellar hook-associated protein FlgK [Bryobacteraceae bacterium]|nr:flagellar hook-associated protein FlgK [Bryobacteraceae bacterium]